MRKRLLARLSAHTFYSAPINERSTVIDLGVNKGEFARPMIERYGCRVYGAEPVPELFAALPRLEKLTVENCAIGAANGSATLHVFAGRCASLHDPLQGEAGEMKEVTVAVHSLPDFIQQHGLSEIDLVKMDIEGVELQMLPTLPLELLRRIKQLTIEFHDFIYPETAPQVQSVIRHLENAGFIGIKFSRNNLDWLFLNRAFLRHPRLLTFWMKWIMHPLLGSWRTLRRLTGNLNPDHF